jgi:trimeric autotransporter adhesin
MGSRKWLIVAFVACALASACSDYNTNLSVQTSSSVLSFVSPASATVGSQGFTITANGNGFTTGALILWNGVALNTTLVSSIQLTAPVPASDLTAAGTVQVAVQIPGSAQSGTQNVSNTTTTEISNVVLFSIGAAQGPPPSIASLSPNSAPFCGSPTGFSLQVNAASGTTFSSDAVVNWSGSPRVTTGQGTSQLTATILAMDTASSSAAVVSVSNSAGPSNKLTFTITSPTANLAAPQAIASLAPSSALAGSAALPLVVTGGSYLPCSVVQWVSSGNGTATLPTQYVSATQLNATIPASNLLTAGTTAQVVVVTPGPGGGTTFANPAPAAATFTITQPSTPTITSLAAILAGSTTQTTTAPSCSPSSFTLIVNGTNFVSGGSVVNWNGSTRPTVYVQPAPTATTPNPPPYLSATIPYTDALNPATVPVTVSNGSALSNSMNFSVTAPASNLPAPATTAISPTGATAGSGQFTLTVTGSNFSPCSAVQWNGTPGATTYLSPTQLSTVIPASNVTSVGSVPVTVFTPAPGGGTSNPPISFTISGLTIASLSADTTQMASTPYCSPAGFTLTVNAATGTVFTSDSVVNWNGAPRATTFVSGTALTAAITYADIASLGTANVTVSNSVTTSNALTFTMTAPSSLPVPAITSLVPASAAAGGPAFTLSVNGNSLLPCSAVQWSGSGRITTFIGVNGLTAAIGIADIASVGSVPVTVATPAPAGCMPSSSVTCGGTSSASTFTVFTPVAGTVQPAATVQSPSAATPGTAPLLSLPLESSDHRYAVLVLASTDGVTEIPGTTENVFVRDTCAGAPSGCTPSVTLASIGLSGNPADGDSISPSISADGRYVAFLSSARNLVASDTNGVADVFVRDTCAGASSGCTPSTQRVSVASDGTQANGASASATIGASGRYVTFESEATNVGSPASSSSGIFLRDTCNGAAAGCTPSTQQLQ